jgi:hypothetical protein
LTRVSQGRRFLPLRLHVEYRFKIGVRGFLSPHLSKARQQTSPGRYETGLAQTPILNIPGGDVLRFGLARVTSTVRGNRWQALKPASTFVERFAAQRGRAELRFCPQPLETRIERMSEALKGGARPLPGMNARASRAPCFFADLSRDCDF